MRVHDGFIRVENTAESVTVLEREQQQLVLTCSAELSVLDGKDGFYHATGTSA